MLGGGEDEGEGDGTVSDDIASNHMDVNDTSAKAEMSPSLQVSQRVTTTRVVKPSSQVLSSPSGSSAANGKIISSPAEPVPKETRGGGEELSRGRDGGAEAGVGATGTLATSYLRTSATDRSKRRNGTAQATTAVAEGVADNGDRVGDEASRRRKRSRKSVNTDESNIAAAGAQRSDSDDDVHDTAMDTQEGQAAVPPTHVPATGGTEAAGVVAEMKTSLVAAPVSGGGGDRDGQSEHEEDDDGFEFPALVVDADPDE